MGFRERSASSMIEGENELTGVAVDDDGEIREEGIERGGEEERGVCDSVRGGERERARSVRTSCEGNEEADEVEREE
jgi:hypothetical protein